MKSNFSNPTLVATLLSLAGILLGTTSHAQPLNLPDTPLFIANNVAPNILLAVDDSGSMDFEMVFATNDGSLWYNTDLQSFVGPLNGEIQPLVNTPGQNSALWKKYVYLFPNGPGAGNRANLDQQHTALAVPPLPQFAFARSPDFNRAYFDPFVIDPDTGAVEPIIYPPWLDPATGTALPNADPTRTRSDPVEGGGTFDLTEMVCAGGNNRTFRMSAGMVIPAGTPLGNRCTPTTSAQAAIADSDLQIGYFPATFYLSTPLPASFGYTAAALTDGLAPNGDVLFGYEIRPENFRGGARGNAYQSMIQNFANWFQYYRKRESAVRGGIVAAFNGLDSGRVGSCTINDRDSLNMRDLTNPTQRRDFYDTVYGYSSSGRGTPNREALRHLGDELATNADIIQVGLPCQQNYAILFTDGYSTAFNGAGVGNTDGDNGVPFADNASNTIADIGMYFYETLETLGRAAGVEKGRVPVAPGCPSPRLDCNPNPHMVTFGVTLGQSGVIFGTDEDATADPFANPPPWNTLNFGTRGPDQIDDLWHATINSRGLMLNANTPIEIAEQFSAALQSIQDRAGSASAAAVSTGSISSESRAFQASFRSGEWSGDLLSRPISTGNGNSTCTAFNAGSGDNIGTLCPPEWSAATQLDSQDWDSGRTILTTIGGTPRAFRRSSFPFFVQVIFPQSLFDYLRGDRSREAANLGGSTPPVYRNRSTVLGDIVNSNPVFVGPPNLVRYPVDWRDALNAVENQPEDNVSYRNPTAATDFFRSQANRTPMVYVGANDGMLHGFEAETGRERLAYIPASQLLDLPQLVNPEYAHQFYVDGTPTVTDVLINRGSGLAWRSVLVSGLNSGGKSVFALDVTDPDDFSEAAPEDTVLWEFTDSNDMGLTYGKPEIVRLHNGDWVAIFGNGYNSNNQSAVLFIVDVASGQVIRKLDTRATPGNGNPNFANGLAAIFPADLDGDFITDYVYAGDLYGNLWKFDLTSTDPANWNIAFSGEPLFVARDSNGNRQPITSAPELGAHPFGLDFGVIAYFGTGKYLETGDSAPNTSLQHSFYGIWDLDVFPFSNNPPFATSVLNGFIRNRLTRQTIVDTVDSNGNTFRVVSANEVQYQQSDDSDPATTGGANRRGFVLDLPANSGEMVIDSPGLRGSTVVFNTLIPSQTPCEVGGAGFFMVLDLATGGRTEFSALDVNGDRMFTSSDTVNQNGEQVSVSGIRIGQNAQSGFGFVISREGGFDVAIGSEIDPNGNPIFNTGNNLIGRQTWQELRR